MFRDRASLTRGPTATEISTHINFPLPLSVKLNPKPLILTSGPLKTETREDSKSTERDQDQQRKQDQPTQATVTGASIKHHKQFQETRSKQVSET